MGSFLQRLISLFIGLFLSFNWAYLQAQSIEDSIFLISTVEVKALQLRSNPLGSQQQVWNTEALNKGAYINISDLLASETGLYIKSYGQGSLATSSIRGGSAGHTLVLWNGLPIQSPMLGQLDLALLPIKASNTITLQKGGNSSLWGSGAIGGVLSLDNPLPFRKQISFLSSTQVGSFGQFQQYLEFSSSNSKIQNSTRLIHQQADNNFSYFLADALPERQQKNARYAQQLLLHDFQWKISPQKQISLHFWQQKSDRQIPPTIVQNKSEAHQDDQATRIIMSYKDIGKQSAFQLKGGFFHEKLNYFDDQIRLASKTQFSTLLGEISKHWEWDNSHQILIGSTNIYTVAQAEAYQSESANQYQGAIFLSWKFEKDHFRSQLSLRQPWDENQALTFLPALGLEYQLAPQIKLRGKISRNYRLPTLNDSFWQPGGNPDLSAESGWSQELGLDLQAGNKTVAYNFSITAFSRRIKDWILWSPEEGLGYWSASNLSKVWSRGLEPRFSINYKNENYSLAFNAAYDYIKSTNLIALERPRRRIGDQLIYTPIHKLYGSLSLEWKNFNFNYQHVYTGATRGVNEELDAFQISNVRLAYNPSFSKYKSSIFCQINNLWDRDYFVIERRPMPGIHFQTGIQFTFNKTQD